MIIQETEKCKSVRRHNVDGQVQCVIYGDRVIMFINVAASETRIYSIFKQKKIRCVHAKTNYIFVID